MAALRGEAAVGDRATRGCAQQVARHATPLFRELTGVAPQLQRNLIRFRWQMRRAAAAAGRPDPTFHQLGHTGAALAAATGATMAYLMSRLGHTTSTMATRYQHTAADRDRVLAAALSTLARAAVPQ